MKIEVKITDDDGNVQKYVTDGSLPSREDAYKEGLSRRRRHEKNIDWKAKIFVSGAMWAKMKLTGISDVIGSNQNKKT